MLHFVKYVSMFDPCPKILCEAEFESGRLKNRVKEICKSVQYSGCIIAPLTGFIQIYNERQEQKVESNDAKHLQLDW